LNLGLKLDESLANIKFILAKHAGIEVTDLFDFMPYHDAPEISFEEAMQNYNSA